MKIKTDIAISDSGFVFDPTTGESYRLNETGIEIMKMIKEGKNEQDIISEITKKYDVDDITFEQNFYDFLRLLSHYNLTEI